jgi:hypothetical protein
MGHKDRGQKGHSPISIRRTIGERPVCPHISPHTEFLVASQIAAWSGHSHKTRSCPSGHGGFNFRTRFHRERGGGAIEANATYPCQICSQDVDNRSFLRRTGKQTYKRPKLCGNTENCATPVGRIAAQITTLTGGSIEIPVSFL